MKIQWLGGLKFNITGKKNQISINDLSITANVYLFSKFQDGKEENGKAKIIDWPGEYEVGGTTINCLNCDSEEENLIFYLDVDGIKICHLGNFQGSVTEHMIQEISETDVLILPLGGNSSITAQKAHEIIEEIDPRIVVPTNYTDTDFAEFKKEMGLHDLEVSDKLEISSRSQLPEDRTEYVILEAA